MDLKNLTVAIFVGNLRGQIPPIGRADLTIHVPDVALQALTEKEVDARNLPGGEMPALIRQLIRTAGLEAVKAFSDYCHNSPGRPAGHGQEQEWHAIEWALQERLNPTPTPAA